MEFVPYHHENSFFIATILTFVSLLLVILTLRSLSRNKFYKSEATSLSASAVVIKQSSSPLSSLCNGSVKEFSDSAVDSDGYLNGCVQLEDMVATRNAAVVVAQKDTGASMMEQLVPEITTHALSYLDYPSLCRLSMTNSSMRKAANDDNAWKALYRKDFTLEQDNVTPVNGWKAYYAATRAITNVNEEFFNIVRQRSSTEMSRFWLNSDYVKCAHASGELFSGYDAVIQGWQMAFVWDHRGFDFQVRDVRARVLTDIAWVTMKSYLNIDAGPFVVTNVFELHNGRWYMVHHHSSLMIMDVVGNQLGHHG